MKVNIINDITDQPHGGGNQFLRALRDQLIKKQLYTDDPSNTDVFLFNSHQNVEKTVFYKNKYPKKPFIHRVDGPMRLYNTMEDTRDDVVYLLNDRIATATIFQSKWSRNRNLDMGIKNNKPFTTIINAVDGEVFNNKKEKPSSNKIRIISTSFSTNIKKGFNHYKFLDEKLDFSKYEYSFVGRSPFEYKNIKQVGCLQTKEVADQLKKHDIFITASENDPCSNSLIEALSCGLPALTLNSGGHPEILGAGGLTYNEPLEMLDKIEKIVFNIDMYKNQINIKDIDTVTEEYISFFVGVNK